jgi:electron transfer flavoprotein alpha subunit
MVESLYSVEQEQQAIWVFLEQEGGTIANVSLELLTHGRKLADEMNWHLTGLLLGQNTIEHADEALAYGADEIILIEHPLLELFTVDAYSHVVFEALMTHKPSVFLLGATPNGRDLAGRLAVRLRAGLTADCTDLRMKSDGILISEVTGFGGGILALIEAQTHRPQMATVRPGVFQIGAKVSKVTGRISIIPIEISDDIISTKIVERVVGESLDLSQTETLVIGGRGMGEHFGMIRELATLLDGDYGATRPPVDEGHVERERQIGQTGVICRPKVALVCGVSGAFHFVVGIQDADIVIAINSDPDAPVFDYADYCIVGDVFEILPALMTELQSLREVSYG